MIKIRKMIKMTSEMSMASMSDIAFLLIIFFMVASVFIIKDGIHLVLPDKNKTPVLMSSKNIITITIKESNIILYNNKPVVEKVIEEKLIKAKENNKGIFVLLKIDKGVKYHKAIDLIDMVKYSGIKKLSIRMI